MAKQEVRVTRLLGNGVFFGSDSLEQSDHGTLTNPFAEDIALIREGLFDWASFSSEAVDLWQDYVPGPDILERPRPTPEELKSLEWSSLVREEHTGAHLTRHIKEAWDIWEEFQRGETTLHPYVVMAGTMGSGKTLFGNALNRARPAVCKHYPEMYEDNPDIQAFYSLLAGFTDPAIRGSSHFRKWVELLLDIQGDFQGYFAGLKFLQKAMAMGDLRRYAAIQDVDSGQDGVYFHTQDRLIHNDKLVQELGIARLENRDSYLRDTCLRTRLLPPNLQKPIMVYVWAPYEVAKARILETRGRDFENRVPPGYLKALHLNTIQWMLAMQQAGVPVIIVDAEKTDFRPWQPGRPAAVDLVWAEIEKAHQELWPQNEAYGWGGSS